MGLLQKLRGTIEALFSIGLGSTAVQLKNNAGALEARDATDAAYVVARGATSVAGANDLLTRAAGDARFGANAVKAISFPLALVTAASAEAIPTNAKVLRAAVEIVTPYDAGTVALGDGTTVDLAMATSESDLVGGLAGDIFAVSQNTTWPLGTVVTATVAGGPATGAANIIVEYTQPSA